LKNDPPVISPAAKGPLIILPLVFFDLTFFRNADAAERKGDATRHGKGVKRRGVQALGPVRLRPTDPVKI
jgi:hypothetical protein